MTQEKQVRVLRICFVDFAGPINPEMITAILRHNHEVVIDETNPDIVFYSVFGSRHLDFTEVPRIFFTGENVIPDFNLCDFAFGFAWMSFEDRYYRCPNFVLYKELGLLSKKVPLNDAQIDEVLNRPRFCNFIYSNANADPYRDQLFYAIGQVGSIDSAGAHLNNTEKRLGANTLGLSQSWDKATATKIDFQRNYRFSIAAENSSSPGYTTEKLVHALISDTIPIYWGDPKVGRQFNTKRFVNCHDYDTIDGVVARVREIEDSPSLAKKMLSEPIFPSGELPEELKLENLINQLELIISNPKQLLSRRNRHVWGKMYEERRRAEVEAIEWQRRRLLRIIAGKLKTAKSLVFPPFATSRTSGSK